MNKAILIIDMPTNCGECEMCVNQYSLGYWCHAFKGGFIGFNNTIPKPDWCPLKPAPEKIDVSVFDDSIKAGTDNELELGAYMYDRGIYRGYNTCIDKIVGE